MSSNPFTRHLEGVTDPSDWKDTKIPELKQLDSLQRCYICKEFLKGPVITGCFHTFCSHCIREYLLVDHHCPLCKSEQFESNLKRDILLEEIVTIYSSLRCILLENLQVARTANITGEKEKDKEKGREKRKVEEASGGSSESVIEVLSDDCSDNGIKQPALKKAKILENVITSAVPKKSDMVECPVCSEIMDAYTLQSKHIDNCLSGKRPSSSSSRINAPKKKATSRNGITSFFKNSTSESSSSCSPEINKAVSRTKTDHSKYYFDMADTHKKETKKLPRLDYSSLSTSKLREKLTELKLPTKGTRLQLELRYNQYYVLHNSNLDSNRPIAEKLLRSKLSQWESSHSAFNSSNTPGLFDVAGYSHNKSISDKDFSRKLWMKTFYKEYRRLIKAAIRSQKSASKNSNVAGDTEPPQESTTAKSSPAQGDSAAAAKSPGTDANLPNDHTPASDTHSSTPVTTPKAPQHAVDPREDDFSLDFKQAIEESQLFISPED